MPVGNLVKRLQDIMRKDAGINGDAQRIEQMVWMFFLKVYDAAEEDWELDAMDEGETFQSIIPEELRWRNWAPSNDDEGKLKSDVLTGQSLLDFINEKLFRVLKGEDSLDGSIKGIKVTADTARHQAVVRDVFQEVNQYMKNGVLLRQMIDEIEKVDLLDSKESHAFGDMYETLLKDLQAAGNAGEFYTPRPVTDFTVRHLKPQLGELMGDLACGTGGFIVSTLKYLEQQKKTAADETLFQQSVMGQEWKPFPYLLAVTNIMLHGIKDPMLYHTDSLGKNMSEYQEDGKLDTIAMNPPYGGATDSATKMNFKAEYRSSETADLFMVLIMQRLARGGRAGVVVPDGFLFGTDGPKLAIKKRLLTEFNLHTIIRLPGSVFSPYTSIATNILFFNNEKAEAAPEGYATKETWFYRMDMPEGYKHFSKTRPIENRHFEPVNQWWEHREVLEEGEKSRSFTPQELMDLGCNFDQCKFPKEEEEVLRPEELLKKYHELKDTLNQEIESIVQNFEAILDNQESSEFIPSIKNPCGKLATLVSAIPEQLKKSILQEAIEGRLVPQDPNEEPASVLLDNIRKEKKRLVKEGKLKKKNLEETPISEKEMPNPKVTGWEYVRLSFVTSLIEGEKLEGDYVCLDAKYLRGKSSGDMLSRGRFVKQGDNIILVDGENSGEVFTVPCDGYMGSTFKQLWVSDSMYLPYILCYIRYYKDILRNNKKGAAIPHLNKEIFANLVLGIPPLQEQHRIVLKIEQLLNKINQLKEEK